MATGLEKVSFHPIPKERKAMPKNAQTTKPLDSLVAQMVKRLPTMWETWVQSLGWEDPWRRKWQSTPVFFPGESHGQRSLVGYSPWGHKELDTTE